MDDDETIIQRVLSGDDEAFGALVERHGRSVRRVVNGMLDRRDDREDVAQDVFLALFRMLARYDPSRLDFRTWALMVTRHRCLNALRRRRPGPEVRELAGGRRPEETLESAELFQRLDRALASLTPHQRSAFVLAEIEELTYAEVARIEGTTEGTVKSRIARARARLRGALRRSGDGS